MSTTEAPPAAAGVIGQRLLRRGDPLLTGAATYTSDLEVPGARHLAILRSPDAHARITAIDTTAAAAMPGVVAAHTGAGLADVPLPAGPFHEWMAIHGTSTKSDTAGTDVGDHTGVTARTTTASPDDGGQS